MKHYSRRAPEGLDRRDDWRDHAACTGKGDIFLPRNESNASSTEPKRICAACPVQQQCLDSAMEEEGAADQFRRAGVRGGLTPAERAVLASRQGPATLADLTAVERRREEAQARTGKAIDMIRQGAPDSQVAAAVGLAPTTVGKIRRELGIPVHTIAKTPEETYTKRTEPVDGGHVRWTGISQSATVNGRSYTPGRLAFLLHHGRDAVGWVQVACDWPGCVKGEHLTDRLMRERQAVDA